MKTFYDWKLMLFLLMVGVGIVACSGDDNNSEVIDGVNVIKGKKLAELQVYGETMSESSNVYKISYDSKGRLSGITYKNPMYEKPIELKIDYDLRELNFSENQSYMFLLNKHGYISQISDCKCEYDENGYLVAATSTENILQLVYDEGEIIQSIIESIASGNIKTNYFYYGGNSDTGELYFTINSPGTKKYRGITNEMMAIRCFIAYQSGLFGKTDIHTNSFGETSKVKAFIKKITPYTTETIQCDLRYE